MWLAEQQVENSSGGWDCPELRPTCQHAVRMESWRNGAAGPKSSPQEEHNAAAPPTHQYAVRYGAQHSWGKEVEGHHLEEAGEQQDRKQDEAPEGDVPAPAWRGTCGGRAVDSCVALGIADTSRLGAPEAPPPPWSVRAHKAGRAQVREARMTTTAPRAVGTNPHPGAPELLTQRGVTTGPQQRRSTAQPLLANGGISWTGPSAPTPTLVAQSCAANTAHQQAVLRYRHRDTQQLAA